MLKPKKKITKKEIKRDPFLETIDQAQAHLEENRSRYLQIGILLLVLLLGYNVISDNNLKRDVDASSALGDALLTLDFNDKTTAQFQLETVIKEYDNTLSASLAEYYLGKMSYDATNLEEANRYLKSYLVSNPKGFLAPSASILLADIATSNGNLLDAITFLDKSINNSNSKKDLKLLKLRKAEVELLNGQKSKAKDIVEKLLLDEDLSIWNKQIAQEIMGKVLS